MMKKTTEEYFSWLCDIVDDGEHLRNRQNVLAYLFLVRFISHCPMDDNRADDGLNLRYIFANERGYHQAEIAYYLDNQECSILEMMIALAKRCEDIMCDDISDRTAFWFWSMMSNLGLLSYQNDSSMVDILSILETFNNRGYRADGSGGLFYIPNFDGDLRTIDIWYQMQLYLKDKN